MPSATFVVPGSLETRTGGYVYDRRIVQGLRTRGWDVDVVELEGAFPNPSAEDLRNAECALGRVRAGAMLVVDSLALGAMPGIVEREACRVRIAALVHLPLSANIAIDPEAAARFEEGERRALRAVERVVVTGEIARSMLARYDLDPDRVEVIEPGTDRAPLARGSTGGCVTLLCVGTIHPGKGYETLLHALARIEGGRWRLECAGSLTRDAGTVARVRSAVARLGLCDRVSLLGDLDEPSLAAAYDRADVFVLATRQETYGMAVAEALARGLPVVSTQTGAIPELVGDGAGVVVPVDDTEALAEALGRVVRDPARLARLAAGARRVRDRLPTWDDASARMAEALAR